MNIHLDHDAQKWLKPNLIWREKHVLCSLTSSFLSSVGFRLQADQYFLFNVFFSRSWFNVFTLFASPFTCVFVMLGHVNLGFKYLSWCVCECILALFVICLFIFSEYIFVFAFRRRVCVRFVCAFVWSAEEKDDDRSWADFKTDARLCDWCRDTTFKFISHFNIKN